MDFKWFIVSENQNTEYGSCLGFRLKYVISLVIQIKLSVNFPFAIMPSSIRDTLGLEKIQSFRSWRPPQVSILWDEKMSMY